MESNQKNIREDKERDINPDESKGSHPAKKISAQDKIDIKESELGREQGQTPALDSIEEHSQIDSGTKKRQDENQAKAEKEEINAEDDEREDNRDQKDGTEDWDAENNRSGRRK